MSVNNRYKDSVFSLLFTNPDTLRELYNALEGVTLPPDTPITINTLTNVLFMERINDISFEIAGKLVVVLEHQSTINPNMPLRCLIYLGRLYEKIIDSKDLYRNRLIPLPRPECFVLYNGKAGRPDETILKLSDAFVGIKELGLAEKLPPDLELVVRVININRGRNEGIMRRCKKLREYSVFIAAAREYEGRLRSREAGVKAAVKYCIEQRILEGFLKEHGSEVVNMLFTEWNWDDALAVRYEEGKEEGKEDRDKEIAFNALNALKEGIPIETIQKITGMDIETISSLASQ